MFSYYLFYLIPAIPALFATKKKPSLFVWSIIGFFFTLVIGLRHKVGGDWGNYLGRFNQVTYFTYDEILSRGDPGYYLLNKFMSEIDFGIYGVNFVCGMIFSIGLMIFTRRQERPWLALTVSVPYIITIVAMGYTRQAVALGFIMWGLAEFADKKFIKFVIFTVFAATFHKTAVVMIGIGVFQQGRGKLVRIIAVLLIGIGLWSAFLAADQAHLVNTYVNSDITSQGAFIRVLMNIIPAVILIYYRKKWKALYPDYSFWFIIAVASIASLFFVSFASTAIDRLALYLIPIQIVVFNRLPSLIKGKLNTSITVLLIVLYYFSVLAVWLNFAANAYAWVPYDNFLWQGLF